MIAHHQKQAHHQQQTQVQMQSIQQQQRNPITTNNTTTATTTTTTSTNSNATIHHNNHHHVPQPQLHQHHHHHHQQQPPQTQTHGHHLPGQPQVVLHQHQDPPPTAASAHEAPLNNHHQQQQLPPHHQQLHHHHPLHSNHQQQQTNSEQQQFNAGNYYNHADNEPQYQTQPLEATHQQRATGQQQMYQQQPGDGMQPATTIMVPNHQQTARFVPGNNGNGNGNGNSNSNHGGQYQQQTTAQPMQPHHNHLAQQHTTTSSTGSTPSQAYMTTAPGHTSHQHQHQRAPHQQGPPQQQLPMQHAASFPLAGPAPDLPPNQQTLTQVPRASHLPPHHHHTHHHHPHHHQQPHNHHHHPQQQQQLPPPPVVDPMDRVMQQQQDRIAPVQQQPAPAYGGPTGQHIPVRPNATAPDQNRLASSQQQQQQRHQIPIRPTALGVPVDHFNGEPEMPTMQAGGGAGSAGTYSMGPTNLLQQQLNRRPGGPPGGAQQSPTVQPPIQMQRQQPQIMKQPPRSSFQPASSQMQQQQLPGTNNDLYQQFPPHQMGGPQQQQQRALPPAAQTSKQPVRGPQQQQQAIRQQVINQAPIQMDNANHHHNQQHHQHHHHQQQQQHLLCNPTPPLTPNAMPPMATAQQLHQHNHLHHPLPHHHHQQQQRLQQQPDEWQPQSHSHPHQQHNLEPISEQPHLPLQPPGANFANGPISPSTAQLKQHQMRPGPGTMRPTTLTPTTAGAATTRPSVATAAAGPVHPQQINEPTMAPQMMGPMNQFGQHVPPVPSNMGATQGSSHKVMGPQQQQQAPSPATSQHHFQINNSANSHHHHHHNHQQQQQQLNGCVTGQIVAPGNAQQQLISQPNDSKLVTRLSLPLRDGNLLGPFKLEHGVQYARKVFHINAQLMETLSKSSVLAQQQQPAAVVQELQFRAYLSGGGGAKSLNSGDSLLAPPSQQASVNKACQWPELFQVSINQQPVHLDRSSKLADDGSGQQQLQHKALDVFQYCHLGENLIEFQVNDCYCSHEFVLELVDRPTLKAFMDSCFKSRLLPHDSCLQRLKFNFGSPGFVPVKLAPEAGQLLQSAGIQSDYVSEIIQIRQPNGQQVEQQVTQVRISLRCPLSARRMRAPTRGPNCKHLQCFDLENFLHANRDQILWSCPICSQPIPFNMLELDQFQMSILQSMSHHLDTDDIVVDASGQWKAYYAATTNTGPPSTLPGQLPGGAVSGFNLQEPMVMQQQAQQTTNSNTNTMVTKTNGTFHPQISSNAQPSLGASPISSPMRPLSGNGARPTPPLNHHGHHNHQQQATSWPQHEPQQPHHNQDQTGGAHNPRVSPVRRPPSAISGQATPPNTGRRSTPGPIAKRPYSSQRSPAAQQQRPPSVGNQSPHGHQAQLMVASQAVHASNYFNTTGSANSDGNNNSGNNTEELSPLAAMERAIIQHEQQMGPPPFDPNSLTSSPLRSSATNAPAPATSTINIVSNQQQQQQQQVQSVASPSRSTHSHQASVPASPLASQQNSRQSPQIITQTNISTPATPLIHHIGPETPATPGSNQPAQQQQQQQQASNPTFPQMSSGGGGPSVDHQPLSNGSASAGSITSSSTMTPSGQSLGSVGMGGDSRCNTAPLQGAQSGSLDGDLITSDGLTLGGNIVGGGGSNSGGMSNGPNSMGQSGGRNSHLSGQHNQLQDSGQHHQDLLMGTFEDKNEILMSKLMMDSADSDSMLHRNNELAFALEEAQWKQQLDRGKSEHLANFLNDPLMMSQSSRKHHHHHHLSDTHTGSQYHHHNQMEGANKMLSGGLNPSDDESANNSPRDSSPGGGQGAGHHTGNTNNQTNSGHSLDQPLDPFVANYLDSGSVDDGAGLPPDDSILDLFER